MDSEGGITDKKTLLLHFDVPNTRPSTYRARHQHEQHGLAGSEQQKGQGSSFDGSINTDITFGPSIDGDVYKPTVIVTRNGPSEPRGPEFQCYFVKKTSHPTQLWNSFNSAIKGFHGHTVGSFFVSVSANKEGTRSDSQARCFAPY